MAATESLGELVPQGGGDTIPLLRDNLVLGRRESCDVCLRFPNVSGRHCELNFKDGFWTISDLDSTNGIKVNGEKVTKRLLQPGDVITIAKRSFTIQYTTPVGRTAAELEELLAEQEGLMDRPLLEKAGLQHPRRHERMPPRKSQPVEPPPKEDDEELEPGRKRWTIEEEELEGEGHG